MCIRDRRITGGAVQGSVLGIIDHNAVLESLDDNLLDIYIAKYVDDITLIEAIPKYVTTDIDNQTDKPTHTFLPPKSQYALDTIANNATKKSMVINKKKTQLLTISSSKQHKCTSYLLDDDGNRISDDEEHRMLGFYFSSKPNVNLQICLLYTSPSPRD